MLRHDFACALDPSRFMRAAGFDPDPWQVDFLRGRDLRHLLLCARQSGKSTVTAALACYTAIYFPGSLVLVLAPTQQQSHELFRKLVHFYPAATYGEPDGESVSRLELANGSRIIALSGNPHTVRGFSGPKLVIIDEAAWVEDDLFHAVTPMLSAGGRLVCMSTPNGKRGWFYEAWTSDTSQWQRTRITADDCPRITEEFLAMERASKPKWRFDQEYFVEFVDSDEQLFSSDLLAPAFRDDIPPLLSQSLRW